MQVGSTLIGGAPVIRCRLRNRDSELCSPCRSVSAKRSITLGWPSVDCYYLESSESFVCSLACAMFFALFVLMRFSFRSYWFVFSLSPSLFFSLLYLSYISFPVSVFLFPPWFLFPPARSVSSDSPRVSLFPN